MQHAASKYASNAAPASDDDDAGPRPPVFDPSKVASEGFIGNVTAEKSKKSAVSSHRNLLAVKEKYNKAIALTPTSVPDGATQFHHSLPAALPQMYFAELEAKADAVHFPAAAALQSKEQNDTEDDVDQQTYWECEEVAKHVLEALRYEHARNLNSAAAFVANEHVQCLKDVPLKEMIRGSAYWKALYKAIEMFQTTHATTAVNARYMLGANKGRWVVFGESSILDVIEGVLIHIWQSDVAAREFINGWNRAWQAVLEMRLDGITCPLSIGYRIQGTYITVTALCPIEPSMQRYIIDPPTDGWWGSHGTPPTVNTSHVSDIAPPGSAEPIRVSSDALVVMMRRFLHATCTNAPPSLMRGLDGRYYIMDVRWVLQHSFHVPKMYQRPRLELLTQIRDLQALYDVHAQRVERIPRHLDRYGEDEAGVLKLVTWDVLQDPLMFLKAIGIRRCLIDLMRRILEMEEESSEEASLISILEANLLRDQCRISGVNLVFLPLVMSGALTVHIPEDVIPELQRLRLAPIIVEVCQVEMISRALKDLAWMDLNYGACATTPANDVVRRINVPNRIASFISSDDEAFFESHVMPRIRRKFYGIPEDAPPYDVHLVNSGRLLLNLSLMLGTEISEGQHRFTHFCSIAGLKLLAPRPPRTAELYALQHYTALDEEIPILWKRWEATPTTSPVRHSLFIQCAFATLLCRAAEKFAMALEAADMCLSDFDEHPLMQSEVLAIGAETALVTGRDMRRMQAYVNLLAKIHREDDDAPILAVKYLNAALLTSDAGLAVRAANALVRMNMATAPIHSATCTFCIAAAEAMLVSTRRYDAEVCVTYLDMQRAHAQQKRSVLGLASAVETMLHTTAVLVAAPQGSSCYGHPAGVDFAKEALRVQLEGFGPRHRCTGIAAYHLMIVALRALHSPEAPPAVAHYAGVAHEALQKLMAPENQKKISALIRSRTSVELQRRVVSVLRDNGDKSTGTLLEQQLMSLEAGHLIDPEDAAAAGPSGLLASSGRGSFTGPRVNETIPSAEEKEASPHSPKEDVTQPSANDTFKSLASMSRDSSVKLEQQIDV